MANYLIQLTPNDTFFFGTGKEFGTENQEYFVRSGYFPQQTTLLGMLRYQLLLQADDSVFTNNKIKDKRKAAELIGKHSFTKGAENSFGAIKSLSPVFLMKAGTPLFPLNREYQRDDKGNWEMKEISTNLSLLSGYSAKKGLQELWSDGQEIYTLDEIFETIEQVGIRKNYSGKTDDNGFYMQTYRTLKQGFSFAFYANVDTPIQNNPVAVLGGERKTFAMKVTEQEPQAQASIKASKNAHKIVLLSDAYVENAPEECDFAITDTVDFRCLQANVEDTDKYYSIRQKNQDKKQYRVKNLHKSVKSELYKHGSVFYFKEEDKMNQFANKLNQSEFYTIGYNHYSTSTKK